MEFTLEFFENVSGRSPVQEFLDELKQSDPGDYAAVMRGLANLRNRQYHREPLSKALGSGLFELRHVGKLNTRVLWFFVKTAASLPFTASATRARPFRSATSTLPENGCATGRKGIPHEKDQL